MLIGIDASRAVTDQPTGTEHYSRELIRHLLQVDATQPGGREFILYTARNPLPGLLPRLPRQWRKKKWRMKQSRFPLP